MKFKAAIPVLLLLFSTAAVSRAADDKADATDRLQNAAEVLKDLANAPDQGIPSEVIENAKCIAIVPHLTKGGFILGAQHGKGVATCRLDNGSWTSPAFFEISGGSWGAQIGLEQVHLVIMVMNDEGKRNLLSNKFQVGVSASASAGPVGRHASAGTDWKLDTQFLTYSRSKGLFAGIDLGGSWIERDKDTTAAFYGKDQTNDDLLTGKVTPPAEARAFLDEVSRVRAQAKA